MGDVLQSINLNAALSNLAPSGQGVMGSSIPDSPATPPPATPPATPATPSGAIVSVHYQHGGESKSLLTAIPGDYVKVAGLGELSIAEAEQLGYIEAKITGGYQATSKVGLPETPAATEEQHPDLAIEPLDDKIEAVMTDVINKTTLGTQTSVIHEVAGTGEITDATLASLATELNLESTEAVIEVMAPIQAAFEAQATKAVEGIGVPDATAFWEWGYEHRASDMKAANISLASMGTTTAHKAIAQDYIENLDKIDPDALLNAQLNDGVKVRKDSRGGIVVTAKGRDMSWREALSSGAVSMSTAK